MKGVWGPVELSVGETTHRQIRRLRLWIRREAERWLYASDLVDGAGVETVVSRARKASELPWQSILGVGRTEVRLEPALPDKPVLLKAQKPVQVLPDGVLSLVVAVPVWARLEAGVTIFEAESEPMLRTWFGDAQAGESAYAMEIEDWMVGSTPGKGAAHVHVPLKIRNESQSLLSFQRLLVRVVHLSIYGEDSILFTNDVSVTFRSVTQYSQISFSNKSSLDGGGGRLLQEPREKVSDNLIRRSFLFFRGLTE
ncbi:MAG: hypothetical protein ACLFP6_03465 [Spirochaetaceae bacterium]